MEKGRVALMKRFLAAFCAIWMASCTGYVHEARSVAGNYERDILFKVGGTASQKGADGSSIVTDDQQSLSDVATAVGAGYTAGKAASTQASNNAKDTAINASNNTAATTQAKNAADAANAAKAIDAQSAKVAGQQANAVQLSTILKKGPPKSN